MEPTAAEILAETRKQAGITQKELAERVGVTQGHMSSLESGGRPLTRKMAIQIGAHLDSMVDTYGLADLDWSARLVESVVDKPRMSPPAEFAVLRGELEECRRSLIAVRAENKTLLKVLDRLTAD